MPDQIQRGSRRNFFIVFNAIFDEWEHFDLDTYDIAVYFCLLRYSDNDTRKAFPGQTHISKVTRMSLRRVKTSIKNLQGQGLIDITPRYEKQGAQTSNLYTVYDANEVIHRGCTTCTGGVHEMHGGGAPGAPGGVHDMPPKKTYLKRLNEEEARLINEEDKTEALKNVRALKKLIEHDNESGGDCN